LSRFGGEPERGRGVVESAAQIARQVAERVAGGNHDASHHSAVVHRAGSDPPQTTWDVAEGRYGSGREDRDVHPSMFVDVGQPAEPSKSAGEMSVWSGGLRVVVNDAEMSAAPWRRVAERL